MKFLNYSIFNVGSEEFWSRFHLSSSSLPTYGLRIGEIFSAKDILWKELTAISSDVVIRTGVLLTLKEGKY